MNTQKNFEAYLRENNLSENTIRAYLWVYNYYSSHYFDLSPANLLSFKEYLTSRYKPQTVNQRIQAINKYLEFTGLGHFKIHTVKIHQKNFLENVISMADYKYFKQRLKKDGLMEWYFVIWYLAATGARISELIQIKTENVIDGFIDMYTKGGKLRRIYIPKKLQRETLLWLENDNRLKQSDFLFINHLGEPITTRGISNRLKVFAKKYGINPKVVYPHSFRHMFAKNFLNKYNDIALLADLMGHESIETTRIYLRRTSTEQQDLVNKVVTW